MINMIKIISFCGKKSAYFRVLLGPFWRPILGHVPNGKKYVFFPISRRKFQIQGTKKKISPFWDI